MANDGEQIKRNEITYFEGVNTLVGDNISKKYELSYSENVRSVKIGFLEKRKGYTILGNELSSPINYGMVYYDNNGSNREFYRVTTVGATTSLYYLSLPNVWTALSGGGTGLSPYNMFFAKADKNLFMVNGVDTNRYLKIDGTTVVTASTATGHLYKSPVANKIAYYKERLYLGDYNVGATRYKTGIMMSSEALGIVALVDGDHSSGVTEIDVTDTKYIHSSDTLQVYRGGTLITTLTVTGKTEYSITVNATLTAIQSSDELWVNDTYSGERIFRWADNPQSGIDVRQYDTFKLSGGEEDELTLLEPIGDVLLIANKKNIGVWNDYNIKTFDIGLGCASPRGYVKSLGLLFFLDYSGIYTTSGDVPRLISSKVDEYIQGATRSGLENSAMGRKGKSIFCTIGDVTLYNDNGSVRKVLPDVMLEYNLQQENWFVHTGIDATQFITYLTTSDYDKLEFSSSSTGHIYEMFSGTFDNVGASQKEIPINITTQRLTLCGQFDSYAYPKAIIVEVKRGHGIKCFVSLDDGDYFPVAGEAKQGVFRFTMSKKSNDDTEIKCRNISISLREMSGVPIKISKVAIDFLETNDKSFDDKNI